MRYLELHSFELQLYILNIDPYHKYTLTLAMYAALLSKWRLIQGRRKVLLLFRYEVVIYYI